ncbi:hypothetical protein QJQ45_000957 [Haematococcus lacustris]|nr:hypothetical protein QJQ45_000957 [Haematococcus lacustris]
MEVGVLANPPPGVRNRADGLAERAVQTFKEALRKHIAVAGDPAAWDEALPAIALGYRVSPQQATRCSPYSLLYGRAPVLPPAVVERIVCPVSFDDPALAAASLLQRSAVLSRETAVAMGNIRIAQHRDTLRYALTHSGSYKPAARQLHPGMFVWTQRPQSSTLQLSARPEIFRVVSVGSNGVARLMGRCGRVMAENVCNLAPCHLPDIDPTIDHTLARPAADFPCSICKSPADADRLLLCDGCGTGYHTFCLTPPLAAVPEGTWLCPACHAKGISVQHVQQRTEAVTQQPTPTPLREVFTAKQGRDRAASAQQLHGRVVYQPASKLWGVVRFRGHQFHPHYFAVDWVDGTVTDDVSPTVLRNRGWLQPEGTVLYATPTAQHPRLRGPRRVRVEGTFQFQDNLAFEGEEGSHPADVPLPDNDALEGLSPHMAAPAPSRQGFVIQHQLPSAGSVLAPHELERALQCVSSFLTVLCDDLSDDVLPRALAKLPQRAAAYGAFADGCAKPSVVQAYSAAYTALSETQCKDSERCINLLLDLVRQDLSDPVLLKAQVMSLRLGDVGEGGRAETPAALHQRLSPQLISLAKEGSVSKLEALGIYFTALDAHSRHVLHTQAAQFMRRSKEGFLRAATPADDSVEAALLRASAASTQVFNELVGLLKLEQSTARPLGSTSKTVNTGDLVAKVQGGDVMAVRTAQRVVKQLSTALQPAPTLPAHTPTRPGLQWCDHHKRMVSHSTAECRLAVAAPASRPVPAAPRPLPSAAALPDAHSSLPAMDAATHAQWQQFQQFLAMQASHSHVAAAPVLRAHTAAPRPRCLHCGKEGHNEDRCFIKHPELRPTQWGPTRTMALATVPEEEISHSFSGCLAGSVGFTDQGSSQPAHAHAAAADRPLSFTPGSATAPRIPARAPEPAEQPCLVSLAAAVATISTQLAELKQLSLITTEHVAQLQAQMPLALAVKASASPSMAASSTVPCIVGPGLKPNLPYALPFAANPSVAAGLSLADLHGTHHVVPGVMLDSGSAATMLTTTLTQQLQLHLMPCQQRIIQSGGVAFQVLGAVMVEVGLGVGGTHPARSRHRALVVADTPSLPYNALIGTDVFYKHGVQLDLPGRLLSYAPRLASHREPQLRHTMPLFFEFPATSSTELLSLSATPLWACATLPEPASEGGADSGSGHTSASYLGAPGVAPMATSATPGCSHALSVAEDQPGAEVRGLPPAPRSKPGRGMDRPQLPTRTPKHQRLGAAAARRRSKREPPSPSFRQQLAVMFSKGVSMRTLCHTLLLLLCTLVHGTLPNALPPATSLFSGSTISSTLPDGQQHLPPDVRFTKHAKGMLFGNHPGMLATQRAALQSLVEAHDSAFSYSLSDLPGYRGPRPPFSIPLTTTEPVRSPPRRYSPIERQICTDKTAELQAAGIVSPVEGPCNYAAAPVLPAKKDVHGNWTEKRFAIDFRQLNAATQPDIYGLPRPEEMFSELGDSCFFSKLDMRSGFFQLHIAPADRIKTAFWCGNKLYQFNRMPFGLRNAPAEYQRVMDRCIADAGLVHCCKAYIDDLLVHSTTAEQHLQDVAAALRMLQANGLKAHPDKSLFGADVVEYLGHNVSAHGLSPTEAKVAAIRALPSPTNLHELRQIMGFLNYYRCFVPNYSAIAAPIIRLTGKGVPWQWEEQQQQAFATLKAALCTPGLVLRRADPSRPYLLHTDWSALGCGAVLGQVDSAGQEYMVACISRSNNKHERQYSSYQGEMLSAVWAVKTLRAYLHGAEFTLITDHQPLTWLMTNPNLTGHHARWALSLQDYSFVIQHRPGIKHQNADVLSRWPLPCDDDGTGARLDPDLPAAALASFPPTAAPLDSVVQSCASYWPFDADYATHPADLLLGNLGGELDATCHVPAPITTYATTALQRLQHTAAAMLSRAASSLACLTPAVTCLGLASGPQDTFGVARPVRLNTNLVANSFFPAICHKGVVLLELFGGLCAGLDMCLRNGISVHQYIYCDTDPAAQRVAYHRLAHLSAQYPAQLPPCAYAAAFTTLPSDVRHVTTKQLVHCGATAGRQWLVVAGWECQDLSPAGSQAGMHGPHSSTYTACLRIVGALQQLQRSLPPAYIFENAAVQHNFISSAVRGQLQPLCHMFGEPLCFDAAMVGSYAHRVRNYWTNLCDTAAAACVLAHATRGPIQLLQRPRGPPPPACQCETVGQPLRALPTLVATPGSYAFRSGGPGLMLNSDGTTSEPTVGEPERALGYGTGATAAARVTHAQRFAVLGRCMDAYAMQSLLAVAHALHHPPAAAVLAQRPPSPASCACMLGGSFDTLTTEHATPVGSAASPACLAAALTAAAEETSDIHTDTATLHLLRTGAHQSGLSATELRRVLRRARAYRWEGDQLRRVMADGSTKLVPPPAARDQLITAVHGSNGHFGVRRTTAMLLYSYWWPGVHSDVARVLKSCHVCDRARASFNLRAAQLSPLPVAGLFYRWGVDLAGPLPRTYRGNEYLMVCIEHLTKHVELVPIPDRLASTTAYHFNHQVLGRFGASAEVVTDGGREFKGEFADLLLRNLIDHRVTSPHHPQADGLAERAVQTFKEALRKHIAVAGDPAAWDEALPAIALGYRVSPQQATRCSPYSLLYGRAPVLPPAVVERIVCPVSFDDPALAAASLLQRSAVLSRETAVAMGNIRIAQHRDTLRYALTHSGSYKPAARQLHPGMFVWTQRPQSSTLQLSARPEIFRVVSVGSNGVARLMGRCGRVMAENVCNLAPCHLPDIDPTIDHTLARPAADFPCSICKSPADADRLLLCDGCGTGYHTFCLTPPLAAVPEGTWLCPACHAKGISVQHVQQRTEAVTQQPTPTPLREVFTAKQGRDRAASAQQLHGRVVYQPASKLWGVVRFRGHQFHPHYFAVDWVDGTVTDDVSPTVLRNRGWLQPEGTVLYATPTAQHPVPALHPNVAGHVPRRSSRTGRARDTSQGDVAPPT